MDGAVFGNVTTVCGGKIVECSWGIESKDSQCIWKGKSCFFLDPEMSFSRQRDKSILFSAAACLFFRRFILKIERRFFCVFLPTKACTKLSCFS